MTQEEKDLLLKDLSARLPYGVKCRTEYGDEVETIRAVKSNGDVDLFLSGKNHWHTVSLEIVRPYLFPLSSMTKEQKDELYNLIGEYYNENSCYITNSTGIIIMDNPIKHMAIYLYCDVLDWLNAHHFDFLGLIGRKLAIDATGLNIY